MDHHAEGEASIIHAQHSLAQLKVAGTADGKEFGQALDQPQEERLQCTHAITPDRLPPGTASGCCRK